MSMLKAFQEKFDSALHSYLRTKIEWARLIHPQAETPIRHIDEFIRTGGKRFRPALFYHAYLASGGRGNIDALSASFVFELFHTFALLHDDIIDNAPLRRGKQTVFRKYGVAPAILAGDMALILADEVFYKTLSQSEAGPDVQEMIRTRYDAYKQELIVGQYMDFVHVQEVDTIMLYKTSRYSFIHPASLGFLFGCGRLPGSRWERLLEKLGLLFQMKDDYEGIFGDEKTIGKSVTSDIGEGKKTAVVNLFLEKATKEEKKRFDSFFGKKGTSLVDFDWLKDRLAEKGINAVVQDAIQDGVRGVASEIGNIQPRTPFHSLIQELAGIIDDFS